METHIFAWLMDIFFIFVLHIFYSRRLGTKYQNRWIPFAGWAGYFVLWNMVSYLFAENIFLTSISTVLVNFLILHFLYKGNARNKIMPLFSVMIAGTVSECAVMLVTGNFFAGDSYSFSQDNKSLCMISALSKILCFVFLKIIAELSGRNQQTKIKFADWVEILLVPVGSIIICYMMWWERKRFVDVAQLVITGILLIINLVAYYVYQRIQDNAKERLNQQLLLQQSEYCRVRYEEFQGQWKTIRRLRHDMKNDYALEMSYLQQGKYDLLYQHYQNKLGKIDSQEKVCDTGNIGLDSIITYKLEQARESGIEIRKKIQVAGTIAMEDADLNILIGNLLDNAIEAVKPLKENRTIDLLIRTDQTAFYIEISNPYEGVKQKDRDGHYISGKKDKLNHGIGLKEVNEIACKHKGKLVVEDREQRFCAKAMLYMETEISMQS